LPNLNEVPEVVQDGLVSLSRSPTLMAVLFSILHHIRGTRLSQLQVYLTSFFTKEGAHNKRLWASFIHTCVQYTGE